MQDGGLVEATNCVRSNAASPHSPQKAVATLSHVITENVAPRLLA